MKLLRDIVVIIISIFVAIGLVKIQAFDFILNSVGDIWYIHAFIAGLFFTSAFTTPLSIVALGEISLRSPLLPVALIGAVGALLGDLVIFTLIKDAFAQDVNDFLKVHRYKKIRAIFRYRIFRWLTPCLGALIIASPLPDEIGLAMMGFSRMRFIVFIPVSLVFNFIGILLIGYITALIA